MRTRAHTHTTFNFIDVIYICRMHMNDDACCLHFISLLYIVSLLACDEDVVVRSAATASLALILVHFATTTLACGADRFHPRRGAVAGNQAPSNLYIATAGCACR